MHWLGLPLLDLDSGNSLAFMCYKCKWNTHIAYSLHCLAISTCAWLSTQEPSQNGPNSTTGISTLNVETFKDRWNLEGHVPTRTWMHQCISYISIFAPDLICIKVIKDILLESNKLFSFSNHHLIMVGVGWIFIVDDPMVFNSWWLTYNQMLHVITKKSTKGIN